MHPTMHIILLYCYHRISSVLFWMGPSLSSRSIVMVLLLRREHAIGGLLGQIKLRWLGALQKIIPNGPNPNVQTTTLQPGIYANSDLRLTHTISQCKLAKAKIHTTLQVQCTLAISMQEIGQRLISRKLKFQQFLSCFLFKKWHDYSDILEQIKAIAIIILHIHIFFL